MRAIHSLEYAVYTDFMAIDIAVDLFSLLQLAEDLCVFFEEGLKQSFLV